MILTGMVCSREAGRFRDDAGSTERPVHFIHFPNGLSCSENSGFLIQSLSSGSDYFKIDTRNIVFKH